MVIKEITCLLPLKSVIYTKNIVNELVFSSHLSESKHFNVKCFKKAEFPDVTLLRYSAKLRTQLQVI